MTLKPLIVQMEQLFVQVELLELFKSVVTDLFEYLQKLVKGFGPFVFKLPLHVFMVAKNAVVVGRLIEILDDPEVEFIDIERISAIQVTFDIFNHFCYDVSVKNQLFITLFAEFAVKIPENGSCPPYILLLYALRIQEWQVY